MVKLMGTKFLPPELVVGYLLPAPHGIVNEVVMNKPVMYAPVLKMLVGDLVVRGQLMLVRQLMVDRGMGEMLSMVCKMVRMSRRGAVSTQAASAVRMVSKRMASKVVVGKSSETASAEGMTAEAVAEATESVAAKAAEPVTAKARTSFCKRSCTGHC